MSAKNKPAAVQELKWFKSKDAEGAVYARTPRCVYHVRPKGKAFALLTEDPLNAGALREEAAGDKDKMKEMAQSMVAAAASMAAGLGARPPITKKDLETVRGGVLKWEAGGFAGACSMHARLGGASYSIFTRAGGRWVAVSNMLYVAQDCKTSEEAKRACEADALARPKWLTDPKFKAKPESVCEAIVRFCGHTGMHPGYVLDHKNNRLADDLRLSKKALDALSQAEVKKLIRDCYKPACEAIRRDNAHPARLGHTATPTEAQWMAFPTERLQRWQADPGALRLKQITEAEDAAAPPADPESDDDEPAPRPRPARAANRVTAAPAGEKRGKVERDQFGVKVGTMANRIHLVMLAAAGPMEPNAILEAAKCPLTRRIHLKWLCDRGHAVKTPEGQYVLKEKAAGPVAKKKNSK